MVLSVAYSLVVMLPKGWMHRKRDNQLNGLPQRACMKEFSELKVLCDNQAHGFSKVVFSHDGLEIGGGFVLGLG